MTGFVGRERELAAARDELIRPSVRLLTLTGPGGSGKTRLSVAIVTQVLDAFVDGVFFVALAAIDDAALVMSAVSQALGVREMGGRPPAEVVRANLGAQRILLLLDNFEQVLGAGPALADLLAACPQTKALVTSRESLRIHGECEFPVPSSACRS